MATSGSLRTIRKEAICVVCGAYLQTGDAPDKKPRAEQADLNSSVKVDVRASHNGLPELGSEGRRKLFGDSKTATPDMCADVGGDTLRGASGSIYQLNCCPLWKRAHYPSPAGMDHADRGDRTLGDQDDWNAIGIQH